MYDNNKWISAYVSSLVIPAMIRVDQGTENTLVAECQVFLGQNHQDENSGIRSISYGKSKLNQVHILQVKPVLHQAK